MKNKIKSISQKCTSHDIDLYIFSFIIPILVLILIYALIGIHPFGSKSLLTQDLSGQYISLFAKLKDIMLGKSNIFYSLGKMLGGNFFGVFSYYLSSPLNLIFLFFKKENFQIAILILTCIKIGLCGFSFSYYLKNKFIKSNKFSILIFSIIYSLMSYNIVYQQNIMWLDGVILLPFIILGIDNIINGKSKKLFIISLFIAIVSNYYIGYMLCLFSGIYFILKIIFANQYKNIVIYKKFFLACVTVIGLSTFILIPTLMSLFSGKLNESLNLTNIIFNFHPFDAFSKLYIGAYSQNEMIIGLPNIYCTIFAAFLANVFFFKKDINNKKKVFYLILISLLFLSFILNPLNLVWHGFQPPAWFPYRYSFIFSFLLIVIAFECFNTKLSFKDFIAPLLFIGLITLALSRINLEFLTNKKLIITLLLLTTYVVVLLKIPKLTLLLIIICLECTLNGYAILKNINYNNYENFKNFYTIKNSLINKMKNYDNNRIEYTYNWSANDGMLFNYNGISHYTSAYNQAVLNNLESLGFARSQYAIYYLGATPVTNYIFGIEYIISQEKLNLEKIDQSNDFNFYTFKEKPAIGYLTNNTNKMNFKENQKIENQEKFFKYLFNNEEDIFEKIEVEKIELVNLIEKDNKYLKNNVNEDGYVIYNIKLNKKSELYYTLQSDNPDKQVGIFIDDKYQGNYFGSYNSYVYRYETDNQKLKIKVKIEENEINLFNLNIYKFNENNFNNTILNSKNNKLILNKISDNYINGKVDVREDNSNLFISIPQDKNWKIFVDGIKVESSNDLSPYILIKNLKKGKHKLELKYVDKSFYIGLMISLITLTINVIYIIIHNKKNQNNL